MRRCPVSKTWGRSPPGRREAHRGNRRRRNARTPTPASRTRRYAPGTSAIRPSRSCSTRTTCRSPRRLTPPARSASARISCARKWTRTIFFTSPGSPASCASSTSAIRRTQGAGLLHSETGRRRGRAADQRCLQGRPRSAVGDRQGARPRRHRIQKLSTRLRTASLSFLKLERTTACERLNVSARP
jgi:hypothetical protein